MGTWVIGTFKEPFTIIRPITLVWKLVCWQKLTFESCYWHHVPPQAGTRLAGLHARMISGSSAPVRHCALGKTGGKWDLTQLGIFLFNRPVSLRLSSRTQRNNLLWIKTDQTNMRSCGLSFINGPVFDSLSWRSWPRRSRLVFTRPRGSCVPCRYAPHPGSGFMKLDPLCNCLGTWGAV